MNNNKSLTDVVLNWLESFVSNIVSGEITSLLINIVVIILIALWIYFGLKIFLDAKDRYKLTFVGKILFLLFGLLTGPIGLLIYSITKPKFTQEEMDFMKLEHKFYYQQASKVLDCIKCKAYVLEGYKHCINCGTENRYECKHCGCLTDYDDNYCHDCGFSFAGRESEIYKNLNILKKVKSNPQDYNKYQPVQSTQNSTQDFANTDKSQVYEIDKDIIVKDTNSNYREAKKEEILETEEEDIKVKTSRNNKRSRKHKKRN